MENILQNIEVIKQRIAAACRAETRGSKTAFGY